MTVPFQLRRARRPAVLLLCALVLTLGTVCINPTSDERAMYGFEGPLEQNWLPRKLAGWPAPYLADNPDTSAPHQIGPEDDFRTGAFIADLCFWFIVSATIARLRPICR